MVVSLAVAEESFPGLDPVMKVDCCSVGTACCCAYADEISSLLGAGCMSSDETTMFFIVVIEDLITDDTFVNRGCAEGLLKVLAWLSPKLFVASACRFLIEALKAGGTFVMGFGVNRLAVGIFAWFVEARV